MGLVAVIFTSVVQLRRDRDILLTIYTYNCAMSIFLGAFSVLIVFAVVLYDKYIGSAGDVSTIDHNDPIPLK